MWVGIDGDVLLYRCGFSAEHKWWTLWSNEGVPLSRARTEREIQHYIEEHKPEDYTIESELVVEPIEFALARVKNTINSIVDHVKADGYTIFLSGSNNFRLLVDDEYKANRKDTKKPEHYQNIKDYLLTYHPCVVSAGCEADDELAKWLYEQGRYDDISKCHRCIASIDKDLDMVPGWHYNFNHERMYWIDHEFGEYWFFKQMLMGDKIDNVPGIPGFGPATADTYLEGCKDAAEMAEAVKKAYWTWLGDWDKAAERFRKNQLLLWMVRDENSSPLLYGTHSRAPDGPAKFSYTSNGRVKFG